MNNRRIGVKPILFFAILTLAISCKKDKGGTPSFEKEQLSGVSQKGPFLNGSSVFIYELNSDFDQTGKSFNTQTVDNTGAFGLSNILLLTQYAKLKAEGYFFNEIKNSNSVSPISLYALSDLSNKSTVNINLLSTLEVSRMEYLIHNNQSFSSAKIQAQNEVLNMFFIHKSGMLESELLDISSGGDDNAIMLAISLIMEGYRTEAELTQLIGDINTDLRTDGILNSTTIGSSLINDAKLLKLPAIRANLENRYASMGINATIPDFEKYIQLFIDSSTYVFTKNIEYPYLVNSMENLLRDTVFPVLGGVKYSIGAYLPAGTAVKILMKAGAGPGMNGAGVWVNQNSGWTFNNFYPDSMTFTANGTGQTVDIPFSFGPPACVDISIYENNSAVPVRTKTIQSQ